MSVSDDVVHKARKWQEGWRSRLKPNVTGLFLNVTEWFLSLNLSQMFGTLTQSNADLVRQDKTRSTQVFACRPEVLMGRFSPSAGGTKEYRACLRRKTNRRNLTTWDENTLEVVQFWPLKVLPQSSTFQGSETAAKHRTERRHRTGWRGDSQMNG